MSLQDDIFDVEAALEGKPELELFDEIMDKFYEMERELKTLQKLRFCISELRISIDEVEKQMKGKQNETVF